MKCQDLVVVIIQPALATQRDVLTFFREFEDPHVVFILKELAQRVLDGGVVSVDLEILHCLWLGKLA